MKNNKVGKAAAELLEHWYTLVAGHQFSSQEFYQSIEDEINAQEVPALGISRVDLSEGGILSDNRVYLRMKRERLVFDVCAAPVGVNYFFSYRFYVEPVVVKLWQIVVVVGIIALVCTIGVGVFGPILGSLIFLAALLVAGWAMRNAIGLGLRDLDSAIMKSPVIGSLYEHLFRKDTYYRQDMRIAYCSIVSGIVKQKVEKITAAKGVELSREFVRSPGLGDLYALKEKAVKGEGMLLA